MMKVFLVLLVQTLAATQALANTPSMVTSFHTDIHLVNFSKEEEAKVLKATELIKKVVTSEEFKERVLNHAFQGKKTFVDNNGLTNAEIYLKVLEASEDLAPGKNNRMDVELELYHETTKTIGYTYPNTVRIWMNKKYFDKYTPVQVADNLFHEWVHKLGFDHHMTHSTARNFSVPYAMGYLVEELAAKYDL